jgi:hypothetical protein
MLLFQYIYMENGIHGKWQLPFVCCKQKTEAANFRLFSANRKPKQQTYVCFLQTESESLVSLIGV